MKMPSPSAGCRSLLLLFLLVAGCSGPESAADGDGNGDNKGTEDGGTGGGNDDDDDSPQGINKPDAQAPEPKVPSNTHCDTSKPLASTKQLATDGEGGRNYRFVTFLSDQLTMFVRQGDTGIQSLTRATVNDVFSNPKAAGYANGRNVTSFSVTQDGLSLFSEFIPNTDGTALPKGTSWLYVSKRANLTAKFGDGVRIEEAGGKVTEPYVSADGKTLIMTQNSDIVQTTRPAGGKFAAATKIAEVSTDANEINPVLSGDGLTLYFKRSEKVGATISFFMWSAFRKDLTSKFEAPKKVSQLADPDDVPRWTSPDGCTLYVERRTPASTGTLGLWQATFAK